MQERDRNMSKLKSTFHRVRAEQGIFYGGNQSWFPYGFLRRVGCGVIGATDVLLHLQKVEEISEEAYVEFAKKLWKGYFPVIPGFGMNGLGLMIGMNLYFKKYQMPYLAYWNIFGNRMFAKMDRMFEQDIPVVLAIGPNFPLIWKKEKLNLYVKTKEQQYLPTTKVKAHFVTATGRDGEWIQISSWGKEYYFKISEYREYVKKHSNEVVSNVLIIKKKR